MQVLNCIASSFLENIPVEPVVPNVLEFDILLLEIDLALKVLFEHLNIAKFGQNHGLTVCMVDFS